MTISTTHAFQFNNLLRQVSFIVLSILMVKCGVPTEKIGIFETLMFLGTTISFFWLNAFLQGILTQYPSVSEAEKPIFKFNIFILTQGLTLILCLILILFEQPILHFLTSEQSLPDSYFKAFCLYILLNFPPFLMESYWIADERLLSILAYSVLSYVFFPVCVLLPIVLGWDFLYSVQAMIIVAAFRYIWLLQDILKTASFQLDTRLIHHFLMLISPLIAYAFMGGFVTIFTNWIVNWHFSGDKTVFAIYRMGARELPISLALATGLSSAIVPTLVSDDFKIENLSILKHKTTRLWHLLFPMSIILMLISNWLFKTVFNADYIESAAVFNIFLMIVISRAVFPNSILLAFKETSIIFKISIIEALIIVILSFILIQNMGLNGVAWSITIGFLMEKILMAIYLHKRHSIVLSHYMDLKWYIFYVLVLLITYFLSYEL